MTGHRKNRGGRPSKFDPRFVAEARKLALLGATNEQMADFFGVAPSTFDKWMAEKPGFSGAVKAGKLIADGDVAASLYHRALGYSHPAVKIMAVNGEVREVPYTEHYPPDATSAIFWLKNRRPEQWREKVETTTNHKLVDENDKPLPPLDLARKLAFLLTSGALAGEATGAPAPTPTQH